MTDAQTTLRLAALAYHAHPLPGKTATAITKPTATAQDLALAYSPGVAEPVRAIAANPDDAYRYTNKGNLVAVISDGSAILGLGNLGALASKPVMEGKALLFKQFANIDAVDLEVETQNPAEFIDTVRRLGASFGGINLEDISAPRCFEIEQTLIEAMDIPVFHDDQHGTAIIIAAGLVNALHIQGKTLDAIRLVLVGAGAAGTATLRLLLDMGLNRAQLRVVDKVGVLHTGLADLPAHHVAVAANTTDRTLEDALRGADVFIGLSAPNLLSAEMLASMAPRPVVFALANPDPEISPPLAHSVRDDLIMATGRSDYPNQVNNVLAFPFIFRGTLDCRASRITPNMKIACVNALAALAREPVPDAVRAAYGGAALEFGRQYILPKPFDARLIERLPAAVAKAAAQDGVARTAYQPYPQPK
ncbi:MAG: malate dehydrogenase [Halothiobacillus sp. 24-54-40]|nr:MAG: malate dehydrogenase [Halothiobacillus sp. 35-54-62]OYZ86111.1 MAG: malate dehydrogenase [Halothiobacillus sp. 24-54-40]OZA79319.1 MAG: malate dehydrogenase [Halothiobacillus sp. 39-53-45]HQS03239.1 malic enzyme-like NAD(P)-binding protein [Halothiobacillus sp.]HQS29478.1 malic enzyme-like NAD(P)-binding protein [Halothiobacillus sp.]